MKIIKKQNKIEKKAVVSTTITWIVAVLLIFFILILFIAISGLASTFHGEPQYSIFKGREVVDLSAIKDVENFLNINTQVKIDGENSIISVKDLIFKSTQNYLEIPENAIPKNYYEGKEPLQKDINNLQYPREYLLNRRQELKIIYGYGEYDDLLLEESREFFNNLCGDYMLKIPQGIIKKDRDFFSEKKSSLDKYESRFIAENWGNWSIIVLPYDPYIVIKYKRPREC